MLRCITICNELEYKLAGVQPQSKQTDCRCTHGTCKLKMMLEWTRKARTYCSIYILITLNIS